MTLDEIALSRAIKAIYMGFIMSRKSNEHLGKTYEASKESIAHFAELFNKKTDFGFNKIKIDWNENKWENSIRIKTVGHTTILTKDRIKGFFDDIEDLININLNKAIQSNTQIEVYDLNTLDLLDRTTWNTMGDKYLASNNKRYMVNFIHLYSIADCY